MSEQQRYREAGVDIAAAEAGLEKIIATITGTWPKPGEFGAPALGIGYFANVIDIGGGTGLAICTDGVGTKSVIADMLNKYDTVGIDCVAMNVNDIICVGARPLSMVDYIAVERLSPDVMDELARGLCEGARRANISISGGEIAQVRELIKGVGEDSGFDIAGAAVGLVPLDRIIVGQDIAEGDAVVGIESSGVHSNGLTLARQILFETHGYTIDSSVPGLDVSIGEELLKPTHIYVREAMEILEAGIHVKAMAHITSDGFLNLTRVSSETGYVIKSLPPTPDIFSVIQRLGQVPYTEMCTVFNMGVGFCIVVPDEEAERVISIVEGNG